MEPKFHRETAEIFDFLRAARPDPSGKLVTSLGMAEIVPIRSGVMPAPVHAIVENGPQIVGSGWYHDAAIQDGEPPFKH